jgi:tetratricopeptide (TPR) repeat protein
MDHDVVEQAHEIYFNVIVSHGDGDEPWTPDQRAELRRALTLLEPLEASGDLGPDGIQLMASLCLELGNDEREEHLLRRGLEHFPGAGGIHGDLGAALANLERWPDAVAHLAASVVLGVDQPDEQWAAACSQLIDTLSECGDAERAEAVRSWALTLASDAKARAWLEEDEDEDEDTAAEDTK